MATCLSWSDGSARCTYDSQRRVSTQRTSPSRVALRALRKSAWCDGGEEVPVGPPGVEECPGPVVRERTESERDSLDPLDQVVR